MPDERPILIAGGGIGGLALALALAQLGRASIVLERQAALSAAGAGIQLGPNAVRALQALGLVDALKPWAGEPEAIEVFAAGGRPLARLPLGQWITDRHGAPYWAVHRGDLHRVLAEAASVARMIDIRSGFEVAVVTQSADAVNVEDGAGRSVSGPMLVGADGLWSAVRAALAPASVPRPAGTTATRTVIPLARTGELPVGSVGLWLGADAHVVHYPVRSGTELAVTVIAREDWGSRTWDAEADADALRRRLVPFHARLTRVLVPGDAADHTWRKWALHTLPALPEWALGRSVLIGDAAHPVLPYLAQGGALALEDAVTLARCIAAGRADVRSALAGFQAQRAARARRVQAASRRQGRIYRLPPPFSWARDAVLELVPGARLMAQFDWLYGWRPPDLPLPLRGQVGPAGHAAP
jgi:salicylate hydroxylase